jgi:hypothetical protein
MVGVTVYVFVKILNHPIVITFKREPDPAPVAISE